jgi:hypothetical protein
VRILLFLTLNWVSLKIKVNACDLNKTFMDFLLKEKLESLLFAYRIKLLQETREFENISPKAPIFHRNQVSETD